MKVLTPQDLPHSQVAELSDLDERRFGVRTAKSMCSTAESVEVALSDARRLNAQLLILRVPTAEWSCVAAAQSAGGIATDVLDYFEWEVPRQVQTTAATRSADAYPAQIADRGDAREVGNLARLAFDRYKSHYHRDPRLSLAAAREVYPDWAFRACEASSSNEPVLVLRHGGAIVAFAALRRLDPKTMDVALFAVNPDSQRRGFGGAMLVATQAHAVAAGVERLAYSTHVDNLTARRLLCRYGFLPCFALMTFHCWI